VYKIPEYSAECRKQAKKVVISLILLIIVYIFVFLFSLIFVAALFISAKIIYDYYGGIIWLLSLSLIVVGLILFIFILRFFFRAYSVNRDLWIEITEEEQPKLFQLIKSLADDINTIIPKRVYLSPEVDSFVFYDSNFWNLFHQKRENLVIGLGLLNATTKSEFKAILAHEFAHFTQSNLRRFSLINIWNQIIYKMLIDEEGYQVLLADFNIKIVATIVHTYAIAVKTVFQKIFDTISVYYNAFSIELEYHADEVSAIICGSVPNISALLRVDLAFDTFNYIGEFYHNLIPENVNTDNIYPQHNFAVLKRAKDLGIEIQNGLPMVTEKFAQQLNPSKIVFKDQWNSHPEKAKRIERFKKLNVDTLIENEFAWDYINDKETLQKAATERLFARWKYSKDQNIIDLEEFKKRFIPLADKQKFNKRYNNFYLIRNISVFDIENIDVDRKDFVFNSFDDIYTPKNVELSVECRGLYDDLNMLERIDKREIKVDVFEYDGKKYHRRGIKKLTEKLNNYMENLLRTVYNLDINIYKFFLQKAKTKGKEELLNQKYQKYFKLVEDEKENVKIHDNLINSLANFQHISLVSDFERDKDEFKGNEYVFKNNLKKIVNNPLYQTLLDSAKKSRFESYLKKDWKYFNEFDFNEDAFKVLQEIMYYFHGICSAAPFAAMKEILDYQISLLED
jgi:Zn-dependent protease with chaperone function